jgi:hypothetical protein
VTVGCDASDLQTGGYKWANAADKLQLHGQGQGMAEFLRFEFKTKPFDDPKDRTDGTHTHPH